MHKPPNPLNSHRLARLIVCAQAMLAWAAAVLFGDLVASRRRIRQRYGLLSIDKLTALIRNLMIARAGEQFGKPRRQHRRYAPPGFRRRARARNPLRSIAGSRLRRFLREGDGAARFARLAHILSHLDAYVRAFLERRARNGINRLIALVAARPPHEPLRHLAAHTPALADSS
jgi:hypothetical protein